MKTNGTTTDAQDSTDTSEATRPEKKPAAPLQNPLKLLGEALRKEKAEQSGDDAEEQADDDADEKPAKKKAKSKPKNLDQLAEALELEVADLYDVEIPAKLKGAEALKLGKLKDLADEHGALTVKGLKLDEDRRTWEAGKMAAEQEFRELLRALPSDAIKPEALEKLRATLRTKQAQERELALEHIKEWNDPKVRADDLRGMVAHMRSYDLPESYLLTNFDHRLVRLIRDSWQRSETIRKALESVEERKPTTPPKGKAHGNKPVKRETSTGPASRVQSNVSNFMNIINKAATPRS